MIFSEFNFNWPISEEKIRNSIAQMVGHFSYQLCRILQKKQALRTIGPEADKKLAKECHSVVEFSLIKGDFLWAIMKK